MELIIVKNKNFITYVFLGTIFFMMIMYPVMFGLIHLGTVKPSFSNFYSVQKEEGNTLDILNAKITNLKNNINTKLTNYLFLYSEINQYYPNLKNKLNFYKKNDFKPMGTNSDGEYTFYSNDGYYILETNQNDLYIEESLDKSIDFWNDLSTKTDLYIYLPSRYEFRNFGNTYSLRNLSKTKEEFINSLNSNIVVKELEIEDDKEYQEKFYHTDHHWNAYGALDGYYDIASMLNINANNYEVVKTDVIYHGSIAKMVADNKLNDYFTYINTGLDIKANINGKAPDNNFKPMKIKENKGTYYDQYVGYYNGLYEEVVYTYGNGLDNLLIIGDSYAWQIDYILASHFNKTYVLNPKYVENIDLDKYLQENNITKTLVLMETQTTLFDNYEYHYIDHLGGN